MFREVIKEKNGLIFVTGGTGSGKTTTLAAMLNEINQTNEVHVVTLEDPIEFLHPHLKATFSQRELGRDFYTFPDGLRAALRQAPKIIFVGEIRDRETMEIALTAGETGHVVFSTLHTISAGQTINRILGMFSKDEEQQVRERLAGSLRYIISQRLVPKKGGGRLLVTELMGSNLRTPRSHRAGRKRKPPAGGHHRGRQHAGWHSFEQSLVKAYEKDLITEETALLYCVNKSAMHQRIDHIVKHRKAAPSLDELKLRMDQTAAETCRPAQAANPAGNRKPDRPPDDRRENFAPRSTRFLRRRFQRIQTGTAAERLVKRRAEMAQAVVAHFQRGLGDVVFAGLEQFRRALHAQLAQMLRDGVTGLRGKNPAQIKMAATDFFAEFFQRRRLGEILLQ